MHSFTRLMNISAVIAYLVSLAVARAEPPITIGSARELFVDQYLIERLDAVELRLHEPQSAGPVLRFDQPHEGVFAGYVTVIKDADTYRMYYRGLTASKNGQADHSTKAEVTCYAESPDGIAWTKPSLGLVDVHGRRDNNVILAHHPACHNFSPFLDARPGVDAAKRFKALGGNAKTGLLPFVSADGVRWTPMQTEPLITKGAFDSQNLAFWSAAENCYVCFFRTFKQVGSEGYRWISRCTSADFVHWTEPVEMNMGDVPPEQYYTNQTEPYYRAPQIYVSVFARFMPGRQVLTTRQARELGVVGDYGRDCSDACFMTSRGGDRFTRSFLESFVRPGRDPANWTSRTNYPALGIVPTADSMMSLYVQRHYAQPSHYLERLVLRPDGFVSLHARYVGGQVLTKPFVFTGDRLVLNLSTSAVGEVRVELQDAGGEVRPGYSLSDCEPLVGDDLDRPVTWKGNAKLAPLAGQTIRVRVALRDADLFALQFK